MAWRWRKSIGFGGTRTTISQSGLGFSYGFAGLRLGRSPSGNYWFSITIPGTGVSFFKYIGKNIIQSPTTQNIANQNQTTITNTQSNIQTNLTQTPNQRLLEKMRNTKP